MNPGMRRLFSFFVALMSFTIISAQNINVAGIFPTIDHSGAITNKFDYSLYYFSAFPVLNFDKPDFSKEPYYHLLYSEQALSYNVTEKFSITGSYVYQRANVVYQDYENENRFHFQGKYKQAISNFNLTHRLRFDGRFIHNRLTNKTPFTHRLRYLLGVDFPLSEKHYFIAYEEAFFNTFVNPGAVYAENWAYGAIGKKINQRNKIEAGLLYITWNIGNNNWFNQYYFQFTWINHLNFRKTNN